MYRYIKQKSQMFYQIFTVRGQIYNTDTFFDVALLNHCETDLFFLDYIQSLQLLLC